MSKKQLYSDGTYSVYAQLLPKDAEARDLYKSDLLVQIVDIDGRVVQKYYMSSALDGGVRTKFIADRLAELHQQQESSGPAENIPEQN